MSDADLRKTMLRRKTQPLTWVAAVILGAGLIYLIWWLATFSDRMDRNLRRLNCEVAYESSGASPATARANCE